MPAGRSSKEVADTSTPLFPVVPNRYLIVRRLNWQKSDDKVTLPTYQTWIVESNRVRKVQDVPDDVDLEVDVSPFVCDDPTSDPNNVLENQAEIFIGRRNEFTGWSNQASAAWKEEQKDTPPPAKPDPNFIDLTVLGSSNPLFPDYVPHNGGVFSIVDSFEYRASNGDEKHLIEADADYFLVGWNSLARHDLLSRRDNLALRLSFDNLKLALDVDSLTSSPDEKSTIQSILNLSLIHI